MQVGLWPSLLSSRRIYALTHVRFQLRVSFCLTLGGWVWKLVNKTYSMSVFNNQSTIVNTHSERTSDGGRRSAGLCEVFGYFASPMGEVGNCGVIIRYERSQFTVRLEKGGIELPLIWEKPLHEGGLDALIGGEIRVVAWMRPAEVWFVTDKERENSS